MKRILIAALVCCAGVASAYAGGNMLLHVGQSDSNGGGGAGCASTGIFNLSNVCNDIYFIGALK